jgi:hypothetical protein
VDQSDPGLGDPLAEKDSQKLPVADAVEGFLDIEERRVERLAVLLRATVEGLQKEDLSFFVTDWPLRKAVYQAWYQARYTAYARRRCT